MTAARRAREALLGSSFDVAPTEPFAVSIARARADSHTALVAAARPLLSAWDAAHPGSQVGELRYRWPITHRQVSVPQYAGSPWQWTPWRKAEAKLQLETFALEAQLTVPLVVAECGEFLCELEETAPADAASVAAALLGECEPIMRRDFATHVQARQPWSDTFALWVLMEHSRVLERLHPIAVALASTYAAISARSASVVLGRGYPFHQCPLASATAQLGRALFGLGLDLAVMPGQLAWLSDQRKDDGGYADADGPTDLLTTLVVADLLLHMLPDYDPAPTRGYFEAAQRADGVFAALGPEAPWLTARIARWLETAERPFGERFRWPELTHASRDHKTGLPFFALFDQLARTFAAVPGLYTAPLELAFIDLAGFREFNNACGQDTGDRVLRVFADQLGGLPNSFAIRDGGDEFLVMGAPAGAGLPDDLDRMRRAWPGVFAAHFAPDMATVAPRVLLCSTTGGALPRAREALGRAVAPFKRQSGKPAPEGAVLRLGQV